MLLPPLRSPVPTVSLLTCEPVPTVHPNPRRGAPSHGGHLSTSSTAPPPGCLRHVPALLVGVAASFLGRPRPQREPEASNWGPAWALPPPPAPRPASAPGPAPAQHPASAQRCLCPWNPPPTHCPRVQDVGGQGRRPHLTRRGWGPKRGLPRGWARATPGHPVMHLLPVLGWTGAPKFTSTATLSHGPLCRSDQVTMRSGWAE